MRLCLRLVSGVAPPRAPWQLGHTTVQFRPLRKERRSRGAITRLDLLEWGVRYDFGASGNRQRGESLAVRLPEVDFAVVLSRVIELIQHDPVQLRNAVYELARIKLQREVCRTHTPMEVRRLTFLRSSLAIEGVETDLLEARRAARTALTPSTDPNIGNGPRREKQTARAAAEH